MATDWFWTVGQVGIGIEFIGAAAGVGFAWQTRQTWLKSRAGTYDGIGETDVMARQEFIAQYQRQMIAFGLIGLGLLLQFAGNFGG